jgi:hypothetical protein
MRRVARSAAVGSRAWERLSLERRGCPANSTHAATLGRRRKNSPPAPRRDRCLRPRRHGAAPDERRTPRRSGHNSGFAHRWPRTLQSRGAGDPRHPLTTPHDLAAFAWVHPAGRRAGPHRSRAPGARTIRSTRTIRPHNPIENGRRGISPNVGSLSFAKTGLVQGCLARIRRWQGSERRACRMPKWGMWERTLTLRLRFHPPPALGTRGFAMDRPRGGRAHRWRRRGGSGTASLRQRMLARQVPPVAAPYGCDRSRPAGPVKPPVKPKSRSGLRLAPGSPAGQTPPGQAYH